MEDKNTLDSLIERAHNVMDVASETLKGIGYDAKLIYDSGVEKVVNTSKAVKTTVSKKYDDTTKMIDDLWKKEYFQDIAKSAYNAAGKGKDNVKKVLTKKMDQYNEKLDKLAKNSPDKAGFIDGYVSGWINTPCDRKPRSKIYKQHVTYGKTIGMASSVPLLMGGLVLKGISALPWVTRAVPYLKNKVMEANEKVDNKRM